MNIKRLFFSSIFSGFAVLVLYYLFFSTNGVNYNSRQIKIAGTGSMYPTFPKSQEKDLIKQSKDIIGLYDFMSYPSGFVFFGKRYFGYNFQRGDIIVVENEKIQASTKKLYGESSGIVKRIIAIAGDSLEIRGGLVYLNNKPLIEPYITKPHSTFGNDFLNECKKIFIPENKLFIMGDNRKGSEDSRDFGLVDFNDVTAVIPFQKQKGKLDGNYRDTSQDLSDSSKIKLDKEKYFEMLNNKRREFGVEVLRYQPLLEKSAQIRCKIMFEYNDLSFEAKAGGVGMEQAMNSVGYSCVIWGEAPTQGYYEADELIENQFKNSKFKDFLLNNEFQEIGISEVEGEINGCPTQIITQQFAGYAPPNYKQEDLEGWEKNLSELKEIRSGWASLKNSIEIYEKNKQNIDRINEIIETRIANIEIIVEKIKSNKWLSNEEVDYTYKDKLLYDEQQGIATKLNGN